MKFVYIAIAILVTACGVKENKGLEADQVAELEEVARINFEGENYIFGEITFAQIGKDGRVFVADRQLPAIRMFDKTGKYIRDIGGEGRGPGEYLRLNGMKTFPDGSLATLDISQRRINIYNQEGEYVGSHFVNSGILMAEIFNVSVDGEFFVKTVIDRDPGYTNIQYGWIEVSREGETVDTIEVPRDEDNRTRPFVIFTSQGALHPFTTQSVGTIDSKGRLIYVESTGQYEIQLISKNDTTSIKRQIEPVAIKAEEKEQWEILKKSFPMAQNEVPKYKPAIKNIFIGTDGRIWVWRGAEAAQTNIKIAPGFDDEMESTWWEYPTYDIFTPEGKYYKTVSLPMNGEFLDAKGNSVLVKITDPKGYENIVLYSLVTGRK